MKMIVAVDKHWAIGYKGQLLVTIPSDQKQFRDETLGRVIVMGRKTFESLPGGQPLYGRTNVVLTHDAGSRIKGAVVCRSMSEALAELEKYSDEDIYIIGGQSIYEQFLPYCDTVQVTWIDYGYHADTWFPNLDKDAEWELTEAGEEQTYFDLCYELRCYRRRRV